jgi:hypothetical protein
MVDGVEGSLTADEGVQIVAALADMGLDGVEISGGVQEASVPPNQKCLILLPESMYKRYGSACDSFLHSV